MLICKTIKKKVQFFFPKRVKWRFKKEICNLISCEDAKLKINK